MSLGQSSSSIPTIRSLSLLICYFSKSVATKCLRRFLEVKALRLSIQQLLSTDKTPLPGGGGGPFLPIHSPSIATLLQQCFLYRMSNMRQKPSRFFFYFESGHERKGGPFLYIHSPIKSLPKATSSKSFTFFFGERIGWERACWGGRGCVWEFPYWRDGLVIWEQIGLPIRSASKKLSSHF